jgi:hypothetical protein
MRIQLSELGDKGILINCPNPKCKYRWKYGGSLLYATCPSCRRNVKILENKMESLQSAQVGSQVQTTTVASTTVPTGEGDSSA